MSRLLRLLSQAGSLCVSSACGKGGVVFAVGPALHTFPLDLCGEVQNFPASFSSSELSARQMAPSGAIAHWRSRRALAGSSRPRAHGRQQLMSRRCGIECQEVQFRHFLIISIRQEEDITLCTVTNGEDETIFSGLTLSTFMPSKLRASQVDLDVKVPDVSNERNVQPSRCPK